jgi:hypothetical protein
MEEGFERERERERVKTFFKENCPKIVVNVS